MDLARTSTAIRATTPGQARQLAATGGGVLAILAGALAIAFGATQWPGNMEQAAPPDTSYSHVEALRGSYGFGSSVDDGSYDKVEALRGANGFVPSERDVSYDKVGTLRANPPGS